MQIQVREIDLPVDGASLRVRVASPKAAGRYPGIIFYSEIFQLTGPIRRSMERLAGHGFVVAAPEIFRRIEAPGAVWAYDDAGRVRGLADAKRTAVAEHDRDRVAVLDFLNADPAVQPGRLGAMGFCIGGHLALRAALDPRTRACVALYPTGVHDGALGSDADAGTLARLPEVAGSLYLVFGTQDPHVPPAGRLAIARALAPLDARVRIEHYPGEHAFMRDEGARFDPALTDHVFAEAVAFLRERTADP
jgi:carboxymethylenebutenolidase